MIKTLWNDEAGVILSAELVLVGTILVVGMIVGLVELQCSVVDELNDLGEAIGSLNQSFAYSGVASFKRGRQIKAMQQDDKESIAMRRRMAGWNVDYLMQVLGVKAI